MVIHNREARGYLSESVKQGSEGPESRPREEGARHSGGGSGACGSQGFGFPGPDRRPLRLKRV